MPGALLRRAGADVGTKAMMRELEAMLGEIGYDMPGHALLKKPGQGGL